jgi:hypothetical protein
MHMAWQVHDNERVIVAEREVGCIELATKRLAGG